MSFQWYQHRDFFFSEVNKKVFVENNIRDCLLYTSIV